MPLGGTLLMAIARLKPDVTPERAEQMLAPQLPEMLALMGPRSFRAAWSVRPLHERRVGDAARVAWLLMGAVAIFLLIACVNVTNLMLARLAERQREFAVRAAVGAGKLRLARLALAESLLLSLAAGGMDCWWPSRSCGRSCAMAPASSRQLVTGRDSGHRGRVDRRTRLRRGGRAGPRCRDGDRALAGDLHLARQWHAGAAFDALVVTGRQAACAVSRSSPRKSR